VCSKEALSSRTIYMKHSPESWWCLIAYLSGSAPRITLSCSFTLYLSGSAPRITLSCSSTLFGHSIFSVPLGNMRCAAWLIMISQASFNQLKFRVKCYFRYSQHMHCLVYSEWGLREHVNITIQSSGTERFWGK
jgi:hypothetical protein